MTQDKRSSNNAKEALTDYLDDLLGAATGNPLPESSDLPLPEQETVKDDLASDKKTTTSQAKRYGSESLKRPASSASSVVQASRKEVPKTVLPDPAFAEPEPVKPIPKIAPLKVKTAPLPEAELEQKVEVKAREELAPAETQVQQVEAPAEEIEQEQSLALQEGQVLKPEEWPANGRPEWAQNRFECLLFSVAGLKLAVPLVSLGSIHRIESEFTPLVGRADWFLGLYRTGERNIQAVDTAKWVMPRQYHDKVIEGYQFLIRLGDSNWGMACDSVAEAIQLDPGQVKWRTERSKRAWLSGTVIDHMCALLDAQMLSYLLQEDARQRR